MANNKDERELMKFMESQDQMSMDLFRQILQNCSPIGTLVQNFCFDKKKIYSYDNSIQPGQDFLCLDKLDENHEEQMTKKSQVISEHEVKRGYINEIQDVKERDSVDQGPEIEQVKCKKQQKSRRTTRCSTRLEENEVMNLNDQKQSPQFVADISQAHEINSSHSKNIQKKNKKINKKFSKFILSEKRFKKSFKISFPKKIVEMFVNHYEDYLIQNEQIMKYNDQLRDKLKRNKKNDYTFEKEVCQILGEIKQQPQLQKNFARRVSLVNRQAFSEIIRGTMKEEVIMRDKIAKNRELYMIQLKVYALRCRSHKLSKKGTFK